jgi:hypothetical protein
MANSTLPSLFDRCIPRPEVLAGALPDAIFAADQWDVLQKRAYRDIRLTQDTYRLAGVAEGSNPRSIHAEPRDPTLLVTP